MSASAVLGLAGASGRPDFAAIARWVPQGARVLDLGCGDGDLLAYLRAERDARGYGVEIDDAKVRACVANRVPVIQRNLEGGLDVFDSASFDCVILSQTLQSVRNTESIIREMMRIGRQAVITFPNFGYWRHRAQVLAGHMPVSADLPYQWFDTPNVHLCTLADFESFCVQHGVRILERVVLTAGREVTALPNLMGALAVYRFQKND